MRALDLSQERSHVHQGWCLDADFLQDAHELRRSVVIPITVDVVLALAEVDIELALAAQHVVHVDHIVQAVGVLTGDLETLLAEQLLRLDVGQGTGPEVQMTHSLGFGRVVHGLDQRNDAGLGDLDVFHGVGLLRERCFE